MNEELFQYLSDEYMKCVNEEGSLIEKKCELESEKKQFDQNAYFHMEEEKRRQLFSPVILHGIDYKKNSISEEFQQSENGKKLQKIESDLKSIEKKKLKLKEFMHSLGQISLKFDEWEKQETYPFFDEFLDCIKIAKLILPEADIEYDMDDMVSNCSMTLDFMIGWKNLMLFLSESMLISGILIHCMNDRNRIIIVLECISQVSIGNHVKKNLEKVLGKDFYIQSWNKDSFEINIIIK